MSERADLSSEKPIVMRDEAKAPQGAHTDYFPGDAGAGAVGVCRLRGVQFCGSAARLGAALDRIVIGRRRLIVDFGGASHVDSTGAKAVRAFLGAARRRSVRVLISGAGAQARRALFAGGATHHDAAFHKDLGSARAAAASVAGAGSQAPKDASPGIV